MAKPAQKSDENAVEEAPEGAPAAAKTPPTLAERVAAEVGATIAHSDHESVTLNTNSGGKMSFGLYGGFDEIVQRVRKNGF